MTPLPYALLDRICELGAAVDEETASAVAELLRHSPDAQQAASALRHAQLLLNNETRGMLNILADTWTFIAPQTSGAELGAALMAAAVQARRLHSRR